MQPLSRRHFLAAAANAGLLAQRPERPPNIVVILADDLGSGELGCQGNPQIPTPHIDSLAANGVRFTQGYVSAPYCAPSRAGLLTGRYQTRFGHERNVVGTRNLDPAIGLPLGEATMADALKAAGYATALCGKWHLGAAERYHPQRRGFDEFFGFLHEGHFYAPPPYRGLTTRLRPNEPPYDDNNPLLRGKEAVEEKQYLTDAIARESVSFIERNRERPFFLYTAFNAIHSPMQARVQALRQFNHIGDEQRQLFAAMLSSMDDGVGAILSRLRERRLEENTLVFFLSDNGGPTAELTSSNVPLRGGKGQLWEGGIRVPFLAQWKGRIAGGQVLDTPVISLDLLPTALAAARAPAPGSRTYDGVNLLPLLTGQNRAAPHETLFWRYSNSVALRKGDWKLVRQTRPNDANAAGGEFELYHLGRDPRESANLAASEPAVAAGLKAELGRLDAQMVAPLW
ncbi:MAG: sulfatase-like hydrolase/transferase [Bryobacterales bacterium]|nr:sulfatase-like hydrolase/transferase [Bryobacterales bacterium]